MTVAHPTYPKDDRIDRLDDESSLSAEKRRLERIADDEALRRTIVVLLRRGLHELASQVAVARLAGEPRR